MTPQRHINYEAAHELADFIEGHLELAFDQRNAQQPNHECGTPGCIAGFGWACWPSTYIQDVFPLGDLAKPLCKKLGLIYVNDAFTLFAGYPIMDGHSDFDIGRADAVETLRHSADNNCVEWRRAH